MKKILTVLALATLSATTFAQTAEWLVSPQYSEIKYFGPKMYKVTKDGKVGIVGKNYRYISRKNSGFGKCCFIYANYSRIDYMCYSSTRYFCYL